MKTINDTFGHQTGDKVLHWLGHWLLNALREEDVIGRYGGDEFVVLLPDADTATALQVAERLCTQIAASQPLQEEPAVRVSVSLGVYATVADGSLSMDGLLRQPIRRSTGQIQRQEPAVFPLNRAMRKSKISAAVSGKQTAAAGSKKVLTVCKPGLVFGGICGILRKVRSVH